MTLKKILTLCLLVSGTHALNAQQQHTLYYENGKKALEGKWSYSASMPMGLTDWAASVTRNEKARESDGPDDYRVGLQSGTLGFMFEGEVKAWYGDGELLRKVNYKNGVLNGAYESYYSSGKVYSKGNYINGMPDGEWTLYYGSGKPMTKTHYKAYSQKQLDELVNSDIFRKTRDTRESGRKGDGRNGLVQQAIVYQFNAYVSRLSRNAICHGQQQFFTPTDLDVELNFKDGARQGKWIKFEEGEKLVEAVFEMDSLVALYDKDGKNVLTNPYFADQNDVARLFQSRRQQQDYEKRNAGTRSNYSDANELAPPSQAGTPDPGTIPPSVFLYVSQMPEFPGDIQAWINKNLIYPEKEKKNGDEERIMVKFIVRKDGSVDNVEVVRGINEAFKQEAIRLVKSMPKWKPGKNNGTPVDVFFNLPITFKLE